MDWEKPHIAVIDMNAEIGSYQADFDDEPFRGVRRAHESTESEGALSSIPRSAEE